MARTRRDGVELTVGLKFCLQLGPTSPWDDGLTDEDLEVAWRIHGPKIMEEWKLDGYRPWGWWRERGEDPPAQEPGAQEIRLAELGELTSAEYDGLAKRAKEAQAQIDSGIRCYVATGQGGPIDFEREAIDLFERVREARKVKAQ